MSRRERVLAMTRSAVRDLKPYYSAPVAGRPLRLDQNTNLYGRNPVLDQVPVPDLDQYPSRDSDGFLAALAEWHGLSSEHFVVGNGSDEILDLLTKAFASPGDTLTTPWPSYSLYPFYAKLQDLQLNQVPMGKRFDADAVLARESAITILATPNNPTGQRIARGELERVIEESPGVVVVDEAYIEYAGLGHSLVSDVDAYDNLAIMRTLSKAYGLAGLRVGYLVGNPELIERLRLVKPPFNLNRYAEEVAIAALSEQSWVDDVVRATICERERLAAALPGLGFRTTPSDANFLLAEHAMEPIEIVAALRERGILIRHFPGIAGLERNVRFGIGRPEHTDRLLTALADVVT